MLYYTVRKDEISEDHIPNMQIHGPHNYNNVKNSNGLLSVVMTVSFQVNSDKPPTGLGRFPVCGWRVVDKRLSVLDLVLVQLHWQPVVRASFVCLAVSNLHNGSDVSSSPFSLQLQVHLTNE